MLEGFRHRQKFLLHASRLRGRVTRLRRRYDSAVERIARIFDLLVFIASIIALTSMLVYVGYDSGSVDRHLLLHVLHSVQAVFIAAVLYNLIFRLRRMFRESLFIRRFADILILLTLIPIFFPHCDGTHHQLIHFFHSTGFLFTCLTIYSIAEIGRAHV